MGKNNDIDYLLYKYFGYKFFYPGQREVIQNIIDGNNTMAVFPTGGGKSICYQIPALILDGVTIVVSPLISLMKDQVDELSDRYIPSTYISSAVSDKEIEHRIDNMKKGKYKIVYIAPERFYSLTFTEALKSVHIPFVAVDEAHCVSQWGHNFRPAYLKIKDFVQKIGNPVVAAFTATANRKVQQDIIELLAIQNCRLFINSFDRPNLEFRVENPENEKAFVLSYIRRNIDKCGIVYAATRKNVEKVYMLLRENGIKSGMYHGGMGSAGRNNAQEKFINDEIKVMVATNAFGMGINKKDVRYIIHYNMPKSLEDYYQEAGRAGRDGDRSSCILLYSKNDFALNKFIIDANYPPIKLVEKIYRRISRKAEDGLNVEFIKRGYTVHKYTVESALRKLIEYNYVILKNGIVYDCCSGNFDLTQDEIDMHRQIELNKLEKMEEYCECKECLRAYILKYFNETPSFTNCGNCSYCGIVPSKKERKLVDKLFDDLFTDDSTTNDTDKEINIDKKLLSKLKKLRRKIAGEYGQPVSYIIADKQLEQMATLKPITKKQLIDIEVLEYDKVQKYGDIFLHEIHKHLNDG